VKRAELQHEDEERKTHLQALQSYVDAKESKTEEMPSLQAKTLDANFGSRIEPSCQRQ